MMSLHQPTLFEGIKCYLYKVTNIIKHYETLTIKNFQNISNADLNHGYYFLTWTQTQKVSIYWIWALVQTLTLITGFKLAYPGVPYQIQPTDSYNHGYKWES